MDERSREKLPQEQLETQRIRKLIEAYSGKKSEERRPARERTEEEWKAWAASCQKAAMEYTKSHNSEEGPTDMEPFL